MAYGFIEVRGVTTATVALDIMCKTSNVQFVTKEQKLGGRLVTVIIEGEVAAVKEAIEAASAHGLNPPVAKGVLASPHPEVRRLVVKSAAKFNVAESKKESKNDSTEENRP